MAEPYKSPVRPLLCEGESLLGYLKRFTQLLHVPRLSAFGAWLGLPCDLRKLPSHDELKLIVRTVGLPQDAISQFGLWRASKGEVAYKNWTLPRHLLRIDHPRFCPACLMEGEYHRSAWNLSFVNHCPKHNLTLLSKCQHCGTKPSWNTAGVSNCYHCGAKFSAMSAPNAPRKYAGAVGTLLEVLDGDAAATSIHSDLSSFDFGALIELVLLLGRMAAEQKGMLPGQGRPLTWPHADELLALGLCAAKDLPKTLQQMISWKRRFAGADGVNIKLELGSFYKPMRTIQRLPLPDATLNVIEGALSDGVRGCQKQSVGRQAFGLSRARFANLRNSTLWNDLAGAAAGDVALEAIERAKSAVGSVCTLSQAGQVLGITGKKQLKEIADSGIFSEVPKNLQLDTRARYLFRAEIEDLIGNLATSAQSQRKDDRTVGWSELRLMGRERDLSLPEVLVVLLVQKLSPVATRAGVGLHRFLFDRRSAAAVLNQARTEKEGSVSISQMAIELGVTPRVAYALTEGERLSPTAGTGDTGQRVSVHDFERFRREFVSLNEVADKLGSTARNLRAKIVGGMPSHDLISFGKDGVQFCRRDQAAELLGFQ